MPLPGPARRPRLSGAAIGLFRGVATLHALLIATQPLLAGQFLAGRFDALSAHAAVGGVLLSVALLQVGAAVLLWRPGRRAAWPVPVSVAVLVGEVVQLGAGYSRSLALHLPLGVALVAAAVAVAVWSWRPRRGPSWS